MFVQVQDNYLAIYPFYCFSSLNRSFLNKCKRIFVFMCFTVQLSRFLSFFFISDSFYIISKLFLFVKNFFNFFQSFLLLSNFLTFCCFYFSNSFILSSFQLFVNNFFYLLIILIKFCIFSVTYQRQLWYYIISPAACQYIFLFF